MALYLVTYDLRAPGRSYDLVYEQLRNWKAVRIAESVWLAELNGPAATIRDILQGLVDTNDRIFVIQQFTNAQWGAFNGIGEGVAWIQNRIP